VVFNRSCHARHSLVTIVGEMFIKSLVTGGDKAGLFKWGILMTVATRLLLMTGKLQHGYFVVATLPMVGNVMSLVAKQSSWRLEDHFLKILRSLSRISQVMLIQVSIRRISGSLVIITIFPGRA
jgi:hypothetical protein